MERVPHMHARDGGTASASSCASICESLDREHGRTRRPSRAMRANLSVRDSGAVPAAEWTLSGIVGAGNRVNVAGVEAQVPSGYGGALTDQWSWSLRWAGDVAYWWARNHGTRPHRYGKWG